VHEVATTWDRVSEWLLGDGLRILATILVAWLARWMLHRAINRFVTASTSKSVAQAVSGTGRAGRLLGQATGLSNERHRARVTTMGSLLRSVVTVVVFGIATLTVMALAGIPLAPLLASAGVGGVALGFGAQSLVKDFLSGVFMILEDQYGVGDVIDTGEAVGTVEDVTLRVTRIRDAEGVAWYVRNGEIVRIGNRSQGWSTAIVDSVIDYGASLEVALAAAREAAAGMGEDPAWDDRLLDRPDVVGVESMTATTVTIRTIARCLPGANVAVQRELRERIKNALDAAGIKAPAPPLFGPRPL
jgi:small conductance mechanosensitive channel